MSFGIPVRNGLSISLLSTTSLSSGRGLRPSLALNFLSGSLDPRIDFTRTSSATYVDATGKIVSTPASRNLLTFTQEFDNAVWSKLRASISANVTAAPDGTTTADKFVEDTSTGDHRVSQAFTPVLGSAYTYTVYAKASERSQIVFWESASGTSRSVLFDLAAGTATPLTGTGLSSTITNAGNGWYRCSISVSSVSSTSGVLAYMTLAVSGSFSYTGNGTSGIFLWGAQLEAGSTATVYTRNNGGVYPPRFDYDPVTLAARGLLIEEQRTNLLLRSEDFTTSWGAVSTTVTADTTVAPDGTTTADTLTAATTGAYVQQNVTFTGDGDKAYSVFLKAGTSTTTRLTLRDTTATVNRGSVDITWTAGVPSGVATVGTLQGIDSFGNGWYRVRMLATGVVAANTNQFRFSPDPIAGTGTSIMWGAQTENGAFATSYIPTVASQVTRSRDEASINAPNFASWYNSVEGTLLVEGSVLSTAGGGQCSTAGFDDGTASNRYIFFKGTGTASLTAYVNANATVGLMTLTANTPFKAALAFNSTGIAACANGGSVSTASGTTTGINRLSMGQTIGGISVLPGHVRSIRYYPTRLTNAQLQALTA